MSDGFQPADFVAPGDEGSRPSEHRVEKLLDAATAALAAINDGGTTRGGVRPFRLPDFAAAPQEPRSAKVSHQGDVELRIEFGRAEMRPADIENLRAGSVVPLDEIVGESVNVLFDNRLTARGEVVMLDDCFCVRITELIEVDHTQVHD